MRLEFVEREIERGGKVHDVVFPSGHTINTDGDTINVDYGLVLAD